MGRRRRRQPHAPEIQPVDVDGVQAVTVGTVLWTVAFFVLLLFRNDLQATGRDWWLWTCLAGAGLGLLGLEYCRRRRDRLADSEVRDLEVEHREPTGAIPPPRSRQGRRRANSR